MNYINAHATSTLVGDIAEVKAVRSVFSDWSNIKMNATKSMIGHCLGAAAGVEAIATIMAIKRGEVHPTINHQVCCIQLLSVGLRFEAFDWHLICISAHTCASQHRMAHVCRTLLKRLRESMWCPT